MEDMAVLFKKGFGRRALSGKGARQSLITQSCLVGLNLPDNHPCFVHGAAPLGACSHFGFVIIGRCSNRDCSFLMFGAHPLCEKGSRYRMKSTYFASIAGA